MGIRAAKVAALVALLVATGDVAHAQVPEEQGFFGNIDGRWMWLRGDRIVTQGTAAGTASGPGGQMLIGYKFDPRWDVALAGDVQGMLTELTKLRNGTLSVDTDHQHIDLEVGYSQDWWRVNAGLRGIRYRQLAAYNVPGFAGYDQREMYGIGPKVGVGARWAFTDSWAVVGGADVALLATSFADTGTGALANNAYYWQLVPQLNTELGLSWRTADVPSFSVTFGGRVAASFNTSITADGSHQGTSLEIGPFVRLAYNLAGPSRRATAAQAMESDAPAKPPVSRTVFFRFDSSEISPVAAGAIRQAADDVRHRRPSTLRVAGQSDDDDKDLAQRRASAVKEELGRNGLDTTQVAAVALTF